MFSTFLVLSLFFLSTFSVLSQLFFSTFSILSQYFLSTFSTNNFTHLTTDEMFSGQRFAISRCFFCWKPFLRNSFHSSCSNLMQRKETFPVLFCLRLLYPIPMTQEGGHDLNVHESFMASSRSTGALKNPSSVSTQNTTSLTI